MGDVLEYYRLMAAWLLHLASPSSLGVDDVDLPLPLPPPRDFRTLPVTLRMVLSCWQATKPILALRNGTV